MHSTEKNLPGGDFFSVEFFFGAASAFSEAVRVKEGPFSEDRWILGLKNSDRRKTKVRF